MLIAKVTCDCLSVLLGYLSFSECLQEVIVLSASGDWVFLSARILGVVAVVQLNRRMLPRDRVWWNNSGFVGASEFSYGSDEPYFWDVLSSLCSCSSSTFSSTSDQSWAAEAVRNVSAFLFRIGEFVVFWCLRSRVWVLGFSWSWGDQCVGLFLV